MVEDRLHLSVVRLGVFAAVAALANDKDIAAFVAHFRVDRHVAAKAEWLVVPPYNKPVLATFRTRKRSRKFFGQIVFLFVPIRPLLSYPFVEPVFGKAVPFVVLEDAMVDVAENLGVDMAFQLPLEHKLHKIQDEFQRRRDDGVIFLFAMIVPVVLNSVSDPLDVLDGLFLFVRYAEAKNSLSASALRGR